MQIHCNQLVDKPSSMMQVCQSRDCVHSMARKEASPLSMDEDKGSVCTAMLCDCSLWETRAERERERASEATTYFCSIDSCILRSIRSCSHKRFWQHSVAAHPYAVYSFSCWCQLSQCLVDGVSKLFSNFRNSLCNFIFLCCVPTICCVAFSYSHWCVGERSNRMDLPLHLHLPLMRSVCLLLYTLHPLFHPHLFFAVFFTLFSPSLFI